MGTTPPPPVKIVLGLRFRWYKLSNATHGSAATFRQHLLTTQKISEFHSKQLIKLHFCLRDLQNALKVNFVNYEKHDF